MYKLTVETEFAAAHHLREYQGKCENLHGHNWQVKLTVKSKVLDKLGMVMDFKDLKALLNEVMDILDHKNLNEVEPFDKINPTTENISRYIAEIIDGKLPENICVESVQVWESARSSATYIVE
jgi:6-pyruvoyltetrahydropterin/6-carboxytetrahydropterin synthase